MEVDRSLEKIIKKNIDKKLVMDFHNGKRTLKKHLDRLESSVDKLLNDFDESKISEMDWSLKISKVFDKIIQQVQRISKFLGTSFDKDAKRHCNTAMNILKNYIDISFEDLLNPTYNLFFTGICNVETQEFEGLTPVYLKVPVKHFKNIKSLSSEPLDSEMI